MSSTFKPPPLAKQNQFKTNVVTLLDSVISQITCFDDHVKLSSLEEALRHKASDALGDSLVLFDCEVGEKWSLTFIAENEKVIVLDSSEINPAFPI